MTMEEKVELVVVVVVVVGVMVVEVEAAVMARVAAVAAARVYAVAAVLQPGTRKDQLGSMAECDCNCDCNTCHPLVCLLKYISRVARASVR